MKTLPARLMRDSATFEPYTGEGAYGPVFGAAVTVACRASWQRKLVRDTDGEEVTSELTLYLSPDALASAPPKSRVTYQTYTTTVITTAPKTRPGQTVMVEVTCA